MCGIVGYIGNKQATSILIDGLKKLEYRGYDSAGISISQAGSLQVIKTRGRLAALEQKLEGLDPDATCGIGHTRWATHGEPNDVNSHPHLSANGRISLVHNGIIENYAMIKTFLEGQGRTVRVRDRYGSDCPAAGVSLSGGSRPHGRVSDDTQ